ncbi:MAG: hypothetical protein R6V62_10325 [Candidatus Fermentibacteraceae bacterium]
MILLFCMLMAIDCTAVLYIEGFPPEEGSVDLVVFEFTTVTQIALARGSKLISGYAEFPGTFNIAKSSATYDPDSGVLTVYSQYPFTANYYTAEYSVGEDYELGPISGTYHDYYAEALQRMVLLYRNDDYDGVLEEAWSVFYPGSNPLDREMCVVLLVSGVSGVRTRINAGMPPEDAMEWLEDLYDAGFNLSGEPLHQVALSGYPGELSITRDEYMAALGELALLLGSVDCPDKAAEVREAIETLP